MIYATVVLLTGQDDLMQVLVSEDADEGMLDLPGAYVANLTHPLDMLSSMVPLNPIIAVPLTPRYRVSEQQHASVIVPYVDWVPDAIAVKGYQWVCLSDPATRFANYAAMGSIVCEALSRFWEFMPGADPRLSEIVPYGGHGKKGYLDLAFFGGSFNPYHQGHHATLTNVIGSEYEHGRTRALLSVVPDANPRKSALDREDAWHYYRQMQMYVGDMDRLYPFSCKVYPGFIGMQLPNPTARWLTRIDSKYNVDFVIGQDHLHTLPDWESGMELLDRIDTLLISPRDDVPEQSENADIVNKSTRIYWLPLHNAMNVSSTKIREGLNV